jgi:predicted metallo-beta-lactamase superfamily hydrolase
MKHIDPILRLRIIKEEIRTLKEMIRDTNNIIVMQHCQLQINEYEKVIAEARVQNEYSTWRAMQR